MILKEYIKPLYLEFKGIYLLIEQNCEKLDYEDIQYKVRLKMPHLSTHLQVLIQK